MGKSVSDMFIRPLEGTPEAEIRQLVKLLQSSIPEQFIAYYLKKLFPDLENSKKFNWLGRSSIDIYIPSLWLGIEYDGAYWHDNKKCDDIKKSSLCQKHGISMIRIREGESNISDKFSTVILYNAVKDYSNIDDPIIKIIDYINKMYDTVLSIDVNIWRDYNYILQDIQELYRHKTLAFIWPEIKDYWMYDQNQRISPEDVTLNDKINLKMKCPFCGKEFVVYPGYYIKYRSMPSLCECSWSKLKHKEYYEYAKTYYEQHGNLDINDNSLEGRRVYDWLQRIIRFYGSHLPDDERDLFRLLGIEFPNNNTIDRLRPIFREQTEEERNLSNR